MFKKLIGRFRFNKNKRALTTLPDIPFGVLLTTLNDSPELWASWLYNPRVHGNSRVTLYHKTIEQLERNLLEFNDKLDAGKYLRLDDTATKTAICLDDWLVDNHDVPVNWQEIFPHLLNLLNEINAKFQALPEKKKLFYHRNATYLREDVRSMLIAISEK